MTKDHHKKIRIYGPCGSGKSYLAKDLADLTGFACYETDNMIWNRKTCMKNSRCQRDRLLHHTMALEAWIIEGAQYKWSFESFIEADLVIFVDPPPLKLLTRVVKRYIKMQWRPDAYNYRQTLGELLHMLKQNRTYYKTTRSDFISKSKVHRLQLIHMRDSHVQVLKNKINKGEFKPWY